MIKYIEIAIKAAILAGKEILTVYNSSNFEVEIKLDNSPLTIADKRSNTKIFEILADLKIPILSEETEIPDFNIRKNWQLYWCIDPLDGTKEFIKRNGEFTVNIALIENNIPIGGVIYVPVTQELYFAEKNIGSFKINNISEFNNISILELIEKSDKLPLITNNQVFTIVASRSHLNEETSKFISEMEAKYGNVNTISIGSSLKLCMVAEGKANIYPRFAPTMEWDTAAGTAIALYANCKVTQSDGKTSLKYNKENLLNPWFIVQQNTVNK